MAININDTELVEDNAELNNSVSILFTCVSGISILINVTYIFVCFKALKKTLHHLLILALLLSDTILSVSSSLLCLTPMVQRLKEDIPFCTLQLFLVFYGLLLNYTTLFLLCVQRYILLKTYSLTSLQRFEKNKFSIVLGSIAITFTYQLLDSLLMPRQDTITACSVLNLYGSYINVFIGFTVVPLTCFMISLVVIYLLGSYRIWKTFFKTTVHPIEISTKDRRKGVVTNDQKEVNLKWCEPVHSTHFDRMSNLRAQASLSLHSSDEISYDPTNQIVDLDENSKVLDIQTIKIETDSLKTISQQKRSEPTGIETDSLKTTSQQKRSEPTAIEVNRSVTESKQTKENRGSIGQSVAHTKQDKSLTVNWELKVFVTCVILALQTMLLTLPLILGMWNDVVTTAPLKLQTQFILGIPYILNSITNPFLYAWRIPEIRQEFKRLCQN